MNMRSATQMERRRKNTQFEQERVASQDYDVQRAGGTHKQEAPAKSKQGSKPASKKPKANDAGA